MALSVDKGSVNLNGFHLTMFAFMPESSCSGSSISSSSSSGDSMQLPLLLRTPHQLHL